MEVIRDVGTVVKTFRNYWVVIVDIREEEDKKYYTVVYECDDSIDVITEDDIKWGIGTLTKDIVGIGVKRHQAEVVPLIHKALDIWNKHKEV